MQNLTEASTTLLKNGAYLSVEIAVVTSLAESFMITNSDIIAGSFNVNRNSISGSNLEIGSADTAELTFKVDNSTGKFSSYKFEGAELTPVITIGSEALQLGVFIVDNKPTKRTEFSISALDKMVKFNKTYTSDLGLTASLIDILQESCNKCGMILFMPNEIVGMDYVANVPHGENATHHEVVCWVSELCGVNAHIDYRGYLVLGWYGEYQLGSTLPVLLPFRIGGYSSSGMSIPIDGTTRYEYEAHENDISITGIMFDNGVDPSVLVGTDEVCIVISENPLLQVADISTVMNTIFAKIDGFTYRPCKMTTVGFPHLWAMDIVTVTSPDGIVYNTIITNHTYTLNGLSVIEAVGDSVEESGYASPSTPFTPKQVAAVKAASGKIADVKLSSYDESVLEATSALNQSHGFYESKTYAEDGKVIAWYTFDQPTIEASSIVTRITEGAIGQSIDGGQTYSTVLTATGATIPQLTTRFIYADYIKAGTIDATKINVINIDADNINAGQMNAQRLKVGGSGTAGVLEVKSATDTTIIKLDTTGITMADGTSIVGGNGVKSTFVFSTGSWETVGADINVDASDVTAIGASLDYFIPSDFVIESAILYIRVHPQYGDTIPAVIGSPYTGWGYPRAIKIWHSTSVLKAFRFVWGYTPEIINDHDAATATDITSTALGSSTFTPSVPSGVPNTYTNYATAYTSANIKNSLSSSGSGKISIYPTTLPSGASDEPYIDEFKYSGNAVMHLVVVGYKK